jgi:hypothetical protein
VATGGGELDRLSILIAECEVRSRLPDGEGDNQSDCESLHWFIVWQ